MKEKVAYLIGLSEGLGVDGSTNEGRIILEILNVLNDVVDELEYLNAELDYSLEYSEALDEDLADLEEDVDFLYEELDEDYYDEDYDDYDDYDELDFLDDFDDDYDFEDFEMETPEEDVDNKEDEN